MNTGIEPIAGFDKPINEFPEISAGNTVKGPDFGKWLTEQLNELNNNIVKADFKLRQLATGETSNIHQVMLSLEKAKLSMELTVQVRNRLLEGYQEVMRMQI